MKKIVKNGIQFSEINESKKEILINKYNGKEFSNTEIVSDNIVIIKLNNGKYIYDIDSIKFLLFDRFEDIVCYENEKNIIIGQVLRAYISDKYFLENLSIHFNSLEKFQHINYSLDEIKSLRNIEKWLNSNKEETIISCQESIIAIIGEFLIKYSKKSETSTNRWQYTYISKEEVLPLLIINDKIVNPSEIFISVILENLSKNKKIHFEKRIKYWIEKL